MTERIPPYNGVYYLPPKQWSTGPVPCPYVVKPVPAGAKVILFPKPSRSIASQLIFSAIRTIAPECDSAKSVEQVVRLIKSWPLEKRREVRRLVKAELDKNE